METRKLKIHFSVEMFAGINNLLRTLDQGGYRVTHDGTFRNIRYVLILI